MLSSAFRGKPSFGAGKSLGAGGPTDPYFANVFSLIPGNGADGGTTFTDVKGNSWSVSGSGVITSTAQSKWGGSSIYLPTTGGLSLPYVADLDFNNFGRVWTFDFWFRRSATGQHGITGRWDGGLAQRPLWFGTATGSFPLQAYANGGARSYGPGGTYTSINAWHFYSFTSNGASQLIHIDGTLQANIAWPVTYTVGAGTPLEINCTGWRREMWINDYRLTMGVARYTTSNYSVPTEAFPNS